MKTTAEENLLNNLEALQNVRVLNVYKKDLDVGFALLQPNGMVDTVKPTPILEALASAKLVATAVHSWLMADAGLMSDVPGLEIRPGEFGYDIYTTDNDVVVLIEIVEV